MSAVTSTLAEYRFQLRNNRLGLWLFFVSEAFMFGGLLVGPPGLVDAGGLGLLDSIQQPTDGRPRLDPKPLRNLGPINDAWWVDKRFPFFKVCL